MGKVIPMKRKRDEKQVTWIPQNRPSLETAQSAYCKGCKRKHLMYPVFNEDTDQIGWWWCFCKNKPYSTKE
ncbi:hypothetical protein AM501_06550 [Aneurinibacillus migulanus]|uniref:hypothetical protein n=2 Tax=Aneurinibacillus migulanus TaxID=47500 RepID=UPI0005BB6A67|nr:hypothetical protein [Aneurinibacillus migulanus]KIV49910.1 hypothetical protein TS64_29365 [Aneurinibacillus migulanus]KPD09058.1 hypothetical protein AM501_06550 [Aneurinibacillus migulanus]MCP1358864.1 hypothetical protein [Aneurinibacillus migulanus]MED4727780.1 hypothetical protein [Aneurinibacillus migulanus]